MNKTIIQTNYTVAISAYLPDDFSHSEFMRVDMVLLELCDGVYFMDGWQESEGCRIERARAEAWGLAIFDKISEMADSGRANNEG